MEVGKLPHVPHSGHQMTTEKSTSARLGCKTCYLDAELHMNAWNLRLLDLAKLTRCACSLSPTVVTSLSASNTNHPLPTTWELPGVIRVFYCQPLSSSGPQESCLRSLNLLTCDVETGGLVRVVHSQFWFCVLKSNAVIVLQEWNQRSTEKLNVE